MHNSLAVAPSMRMTMAAIDSIREADALPDAAREQIEQIQRVSDRELRRQKAWSAATQQPRYSWGVPKPGAPSELQGTPVQTTSHPPSHAKRQAEMRWHHISASRPAPSLKSNKSASRPPPKLMLSRSVDDLSQLWLQPRSGKQITLGWKPSRVFGPY